MPRNGDAAAVEEENGRRNRASLSSRPSIGSLAESRLPRRRSRVSRISHLDEGPLRQIKASKLRKFFGKEASNSTAFPHPMLAFREREHKFSKLRRQQGTRPSMQDIANQNTLQYASVARIVRDMQKRYNRHARWSFEAVVLLQEKLEQFIVQRMATTNLLTLHAKRITMKTDDITLTERVSNTVGLMPLSTNYTDE